MMASKMFATALRQQPVVCRHAVAGFARAQQTARFYSAGTVVCPPTPHLPRGGASYRVRKGPVMLAAAVPGVICIGVALTVDVLCGHVPPPCLAGAPSPPPVPFVCAQSRSASTSSSPRLGPTTASASSRSTGQRVRWVPLGDAHAAHVRLLGAVRRTNTLRGAAFPSHSPRLARPTALNALCSPLMGELSVALDEFERDAGNSCSRAALSWLRPGAVPGPCLVRGAGAGGWWGGGSVRYHAACLPFLSAGGSVGEEWVAGSLVWLRRRCRLTAAAAATAPRPAGVGAIVITGSEKAFAGKRVLLDWPVRPTREVRERCAEAVLPCSPQQAPL